MRGFVVGVTALALVAAAFVVGYTTRPTTAHPNPLHLEHGVPVGVLDTPSGAVAAADNYLAAEDAALLSPDRLRQVVATDWTPQERQVELSQPLAAATLQTTPSQLGNTRLAAAVAASRLESFTRSSAEIGVWHELTTWSPAIQPTQRWLLDTVTLIWQDSQWLVASRRVTPDSQTPVPAWTNGGPASRTSQTFDSQLAAMTAPYYGALP